MGTHRKRKPWENVPRINGTTLDKGKPSMAILAKLFGLNKNTEAKTALDYG